MSVAAFGLGEAPISAQPTIVSTTGKPPKRRQTVARPDANVQPEVR
jgi:hypothetical protein